MAEKNASEVPRLRRLILSGFLCLLFNGLNYAKADYEIGVGIADVTGPIAEINFMGYGKFDQKGTGLHLRQWARSYIIGDGDKTIVFVNVDVAMIGDGVRIQVIKNLQKLCGPIYNLDNVIISGTHTHSAPGGFLMYFLFDLPIRGFSTETFRALVNGIVQVGLHEEHPTRKTLGAGRSVYSAHINKQRGKIFLAKGKVENANINRSPTAYLQNPEWERAMYDGDTDTEMVQLKFVGSDNRPLGVINWFPVHPTSMNNTNTLVSSDNVGYASIKFEQAINQKSVLGRGPFVAAFASSNLGDVSPNIKGPKCQKTGLPCDINHSTCPTAKDLCVASGPGRDMFESTAIIANRLFKAAWALWSSPGEEVKGPIKIVHQYVDMPNAEADIVKPDGTVTKVKGCLPAMGYSFAAGTMDGPGSFSFKQGTVSTNTMWNLVRNILATPTDEDIRCQAPKPILLATGRMTFPFDWQPKIVSTQLGLIGNVALVAVPGEFTTMAGRRLKNETTEMMKSWGVENATSIIAGLSNTYSDYITTYEEYQIQRYEGASTIYGPHTLSIYLQQYRKLMNALLNGIPVERGPEPQNLFNRKLSFILPVVYDLPKSGHKFGNVLSQPPPEVHPGETITVKFVSSRILNLNSQVTQSALQVLFDSCQVSGNPRNNLMHGGSYFTIERFEASESVWTVEATDANWETM
ncbi:hypothetical protein RUM44_009250 [Polyplax serrata]|uniref:Neutral ceramidase n=1 Tax=Polyplax serrata TaxID=468196 RepID=A0ABR1AS57_POLSC